MTRLTPLIVLLILPLATVAGQRRTLISDPTYGTVRVEIDTLGDATPIPAPPKRVYDLLLEVYRTLDVPIELANPGTREVGNPSFWKMRKLGGTPLSTFFGCGRGITGANADSYRVYISLITRVAAASGGESTIQTSVQATAMDVTASSDRIGCNSSGLLEATIRKLLLVRLAPSAP